MTETGVSSGGIPRSVLRRGQIVHVPVRMSGTVSPGELMEPEVMPIECIR